MHLLDWIVIILYAIGMLWIGWYFSRRTGTNDLYMLGGRTMKPWAVGLSLFATLFSTISYLAVPGEMSKYGPMYFIMLVAYPFIYLVIGWLLIPAIMKQKVNSAYELLDLKFGSSVRLLASVIFLLMRLMWMALIIYTIADRIVIPIMGWSPQAALKVSVVVGIITVIYTSMGGLQAVIWTDVIQTFILFAAAIFAIIVINFKLGSSLAWIPAQAPETWLKWELYNPTARVSAVSAVLAVFTYYVFTCGSDQVAIQRYLSTRNAAEARKSVLYNLVAGFFVIVFLCLLGLSLLAYFKANSNLLPAGQSVTSFADMLFAHFVALDMPAGGKGIVISGLLAAAMSSLASGINSSCLVVREDLIARFRKTKLQESQEVKLDKIFSFAIGIIAVLLSSLMGKVQGNLLEITSKTVNMPVAPLFVPFFMAFFVPRATGFGTFVGTIVSLLVAFTVSFSTELNAIGLTFITPLSFTWVSPAAFVAGVSVSYAVSFVCPRKAEKSDDRTT